MAEATFHFPRGFLWGTATSAYQVEGHNTNTNWWAWEQEPGRIIGGQKSGRACDWWSGRWREDLDRAEEADHNAHRLSVEWSRIQPTPDHWDESALDRYREIVQGLVERGLTPMITLHHFADPLWLTEQGGWENPAVVGRFEKYVSKVAEALKEYVMLWCPINEPNVYASLGYMVGDFPPGKKDTGAFGRVMGNFVRGHACAYQAIHAIQPHARVGAAIHYRGFLPSRGWFPPDNWLAGNLGSVFNDAFPRALHTGVLRLPFGRARIPEAAGTQDFLGLNYYTRERVALDLLKPGDLFMRRFYPPGSDLSGTDYIANDPEGMFAALKWGLQFNVPIIVTENGVEDAEDRMRPRYLLQHLHQVWRAVNFNWPVKGYFHWTLVDNFEWERAWTQRFGLWELDVETQARRKRPSAELYAEICRENGISSDMVRRFAPEIYEHMFPG